MLGSVKLPARQQHLYLVLEDWERGYSIHRLDEDDFDSGAAGLDARPAKCPLVRIQAQHAWHCSSAAHGTKILAMQPERFSPGIPLPFTGRAHYDRKLDAWVGLCRFKEGAGRLCCCDVPPAAGRCETMPAWKLGKDAFFVEDPSTWRHLGATLVYMGDSRFCLAESRWVPEDDAGSDQRRRVVT
ncbi:hypothetical protein U9M48_006413 [Paspalum notatum var. saurae]|uniref:Uncharacterized protein n=1 Tax=Paspalum notatum var. saurae TaxID=547442 RepID=A0AAQ3PPE1_PASNO